MKDYNILFFPLLLTFAIVYGTFILLFGLFIGVNKIDKFVIDLYNKLKEKIYFHVFCFFANLYIYILLINHFFPDFLYNLINKF